MIEWRIYYADGSTFDSTQGGPEDAPKLGVLVIIQPNENGSRLYNNEHYYVWKHGQWFDATVDAMWFYMANPEPKFKIVLFGEYVTDDVWTETMQRALHDPDIGPKTTWKPVERRRSHGTRGSVRQFRGETAKDVWG